MHLPAVRAEDIRRLLEGRADEADEVTVRLRWLLHYAESGSVSSTCQHFRIARTTFYRWARRFDLDDLSTLADLPTRPELAHGLFIVRGAGERPDRGAAEVERTASERLIAAPRGHQCWACALRGLDWAYVRRSLLLASILSNIAFAALLLLSAITESRAERLHASAAHNPDTASPSDFDPQP